MLALRSHIRRATALGVVLAALLVPASAADAREAVLAKAEAHKLATGTAQKMRRDLQSEGARRASVPGCWRNSARRISCYLKVTGYDAELEFRWTCMLRMVVELRPHLNGAKRLKARYDDPVCG